MACCIAQWCLNSSLYIHELISLKPFDISYIQELIRLVPLTHSSLCLWLRETITFLVKGSLMPTETTHWWPLTSSGAGRGQDYEVYICKQRCSVHCSPLQ